MNSSLEELVQASIRFFGCITQGNKFQIEEILKIGMMDKLFSLINSEKKYLVKETLWILSNIAGDNKDLSELVCKHSGFCTVLQSTKDINVEIKLEALYIIRNICYFCSFSLLNSQLFQLLETLFFCLKVKDSRILMLAIKSLEFLMNAARRYFICEEAKYEDVLIMIEQIGGIDLIDSLQKHPNNQVCEKAQNFIIEFFSCEEEKEENEEKNDPSQFKFS